QSFPPYYSITPAFEYTHSVDSLSKVDFRNFDPIIFDQSGHIALKAKLKDGLLERSGSAGDSLALQGVQYLNFLDHRPRFALVDFLWVRTGADASSHHVVQLLTVDNHRLKVIQQIVGVAQHPGPAAIFNAATGTLLI